MTIERFGLILVLPPHMEHEAISGALAAVTKKRDLTSFPWQTVVLGSPEQHQAALHSAARSATTQWAVVSSARHSHSTRLSLAARHFSEEITHVGWLELGKIGNLPILFELWGAMQRATTAVHCAVPHTPATWLINRLGRRAKTHFALRMASGILAPRSALENLDPGTTEIRQLADQIQSTKYQMYVHPLTGIPQRASWLRALRNVLVTPATQN